MIFSFFQRKKIILPLLNGDMTPIFSPKAHPLKVSLRSLDMISHQKFLSGQLCKICDIRRLQVNSRWLEVARKGTEIFNIVVFSAFIPLNAIWSINFRLPPQLLVLPQDKIARIRKRKRGRNMLNRSGNTTDNLCFRYRFRDVFSRFRCCVYNGTGPLLRKHNGNMELHVSATFQKYGNMWFRPVSKKTIDHCL